jgi:hypothetical protein
MKLTVHGEQRLQVLSIRLPSEFVLAATTQAGISVVGPPLPFTNSSFGINTAD